jgi:amino acid adenylation domain-containing protein
VNSHISGGELVLNWSYSSKHYNKETIAKVADDYKKQLQQLIAHCVEQTGSVSTPSDYGLSAEVTYQELDRFLELPHGDKRIKDNIESLYRLSGLQQGMLFHSLFDERSEGYIEQFVCDLIGVNKDALLASWSSVIRRHSILRSAFYYDAFSVPVQCVFTEAALPLTELDYRKMDKAAQESALNAYGAADRVKGFDFKEPPLMRLSLIRLDENRYRMVWTSHHLLFDGWSLPILMEEFLNTYDQLISGSALIKIEEDRYEDYIRYLERIDKSAEEQYWRNYLQGISEGTLLPFIRKTAERNKGKGEYASLLLELDSAATTKIQGYAQSRRLTLNTLMQGVWALLLRHYTASDEVVYGIVVSGRPDDLPNVEQRVGMYINTLLLKAAFDAGQETESWLQDLQADQVASREYQYTPLQDVQGWTGVKGDLFDSILVFENYPVSKLVNSGTWSLQVENATITEQTNYPLTVIVSSSEELSISFSYNTKLLEQTYIQAIRDHFERVLLQITDGLAVTLGDIRLLTKTQEYQLLEEFTATDVAYPKDKTIVSLIEEQAAKNPNATAVLFENKELSYGELNKRSNQLAHYLGSRGVKAETLVPICVERSQEMVIGILGILKAGGAYVPIDPEYPQDRISYMLEDTGASIILSSKAGREKLSTTAAIIELDSDWQQIEKEKDGNPQINITPGQLAYVIYTSGSTGRPKGVMIEHKNASSFIAWCQQEFASDNFNLVYAVTSICFDLSVFELFYPLSMGKPVRILENGLAIGNYLGQDSAVLVNTVPSVIEHLINEKTDLSKASVINMAGEPIPQRILERLDTTHTKVRNLYGPTEDTTYSTISVLEKGKLITIGKPISNTQIYILSPGKELSPIGVAGEICIGGAGLARGYLNRADLTAEKFVKNPFNKNKQAGARLYKTGDLGRWLPDGSIEYLGRMDDQVKVRGYRIELGEIENVLNESELVNQGVVLARGEGGNKRLIGYVVPQGTFDKQGIQNYLSTKLPEYMVPALWVELEKLPLTPNGKIDKKALPDPELTDRAAEYIAPRNETEEKLAEIWQELLGLERIGINDNFFELGGHSLLAMRAVSLIRRDLLVSIPIHMLFRFTSISDLSKYLELELKTISDLEEKNTDEFDIVDI